MLRHNPYKLELIPDVDQWRLLKMLPLIRRYHFDIAIGLSQAGSFFTRFCAAPLWGDFFSIPLQTGRPVVQTCFTVLQSVGIFTAATETEFWFDRAADRAARDFLSRIGDQGPQPLIAMHCGGHYFIRKRWPTAYFAELALRIMQAGYRVILIGGGEDREIAAEVLTEVPQAGSAVGRLKLGETAALLKKCQLLIGNDSGPLHLAAALGVPTLGLFGPTDPRQFYPYAAPRHRYLYKGFTCSPCFRFGGGLWQHVPRCSKAYCMYAITPDEVMELTQEQICHDEPLKMPAFQGDAP